jgi:hypothetical protein
MNWPLCAGDYAAEQRLEVSSSTEEGRGGSMERISNWKRDLRPGFGSGTVYPRQLAKSLELIAGIWVTPLSHCRRWPERGNAQTLKELESKRYWGRAALREGRPRFMEYLTTVVT